MGQRYGQLAPDERMEIARLQAMGWSCRGIGAGIGRSHTTVSRELCRNSVATKVRPGGYAPARAGFGAAPLA